MILYENPGGSVSGGAGFARNVAVDQSSGEYLCFIDSDDIMLPSRVESQL